ncbi:MAG: hypothetical protein Q7R60_02325 [bacterium]|nr:hypothetical protein [bacterium]
MYRPLGLDAMQGSGEAQTETVLKYSEGALEPLTPQRAKSISRVASSAGKQADAAWRTDE